MHAAALATEPVNAAPVERGHHIGIVGVGLVEKNVIEERHEIWITRIGCYVDHVTKSQIKNQLPVNFGGIERIIAKPACLDQVGAGL